MRSAPLIDWKRREDVAFVARYPRNLRRPLPPPPQLIVSRAVPLLFPRLVMWVCIVVVCCLPVQPPSAITPDSTPKAVMGCTTSAEKNVKPASSAKKLDSVDVSRESGAAPKPRARSEALPGGPKEGLVDNTRGARRTTPSAVSRTVSRVQKVRNGGTNLYDYKKDQRPPSIDMCPPRDDGEEWY